MKRFTRPGPTKETSISDHVFSRVALQEVLSDCRLSSRRVGIVRSCAGASGSASDGIFTGSETGERFLSRFPEAVLAPSSPDFGLEGSRRSARRLAGTPHYIAPNCGNGGGTKRAIASLGKIATRWSPDHCHTPTTDPCPLTAAHRPAEDRRLDKPGAARAFSILRPPRVRTTRGNSAHS